MKCSLALAFMLIATSAMAQSAYYDAIKIKLSLDAQGRIVEDDAKLKAIYQSLRPYVDIKNPTDADIRLKFKSNPFIPALPAGGGVGLTAIDASAAVQKLAGTNVSTLSDGLAQFLIERANEEVNVWFFQKFKDDLEKIEELKVLFPATSAFIKVTEPYQYAQVLNLLREAFRRDLQSLVGNMEGLANMKKYQDLAATHPELKVAFLGLAGASIVSRVNNGTNPAEVIDALSQKSYLKDIDNNVYAAIKMLSVISRSIRSDAAGEAYVDFATFQSKILTDPITFKIYLGLIYQQLDSVNVYVGPKATKKNIQEIFKDHEQELLTGQAFVTTLVKQLNELEEQFKDLKALAVAKKATFDDYYKFNAALIDQVEMGLDLPSLIPSAWADFPEDNLKEVRKYVFVARKGNEIFLNVNEKNYSMAVMNFTIAYDTLFGKWNEKIPEIDLNPKFIKYAAFMSSVAEAKDAGEVKAALNAAALPAGSSSIKRKTFFNVSLNAYLGLHYGYEYLSQPQGATGGPKSGNIWGVSAPIGIAASMGNFLSDGGSISLFATIIDVGAVASFRLSGDYTSELPEITFENILAPGIYLVYGIPRTPISFGAGWQKGPQLRKITYADPANPGLTKSEFLDGSRISAFIAVDIPLFNLYTK